MTDDERRAASLLYNAAKDEFGMMVRHLLSAGATQSSHTGAELSFVFSPRDQLRDPQYLGVVAKDAQDLARRYVHSRESNAERRAAVATVRRAGAR